MKQFLVILVALMGLCGSLQAQKMYKNIEADSVSVRYIRNARPTDSYIFDENRRKGVVFVNNASADAREYQARGYFDEQDCR